MGSIKPFSFQTHCHHRCHPFCMMNIRFICASISSAFHCSGKRSKNVLRQEPAEHNRVLGLSKWPHHMEVDKETQSVSIPLHYSPPKNHGTSAKTQSVTTSSRLGKWLSRHWTPRVHISLNYSTMTLTSSSPLILKGDHGSITLVPQTRCAPELLAQLPTMLQLASINLDSSRGKTLRAHAELKQDVTSYMNAGGSITTGIREGTQ